MSDFDRITRAHLAAQESSRKWSLHPNTIGAWVAEMDYGTAPVVTEALTRAVTDGVLGYLSPAVSDDMARATSEWCRSHYSWDVDPSSVHPVSDVMAAMGVAVTRFTPENSAVIVPTPAYMPFLTYLPTIGREVIEVPGVTINGRWTHDLQRIDEAFRAGARTLILCNPHNPTGTALTRAELTDIAAVVESHGARVFADEIHAPIRYDGREHIPYASLSEATARHTITGMSASKAFNIPGLKTAQLVTSNSADEEFYRGFGFSVLHGASTLGVVATTAAYDHGEPWLDSTIAYLDNNRRLLGSLLAEHLPEIRFVQPDATYLAWLDCAELNVPQPATDFFRTRALVTMTDGALCGEGYDSFARLVFAMPRPVLEEAVDALAAAVRA